jgi:hypothetical protein
MGLQILVAVLWWLLTPAGLSGSLAGVCIPSGLVLVVIGMSLGGGMDTALDNLHPGANVGRMSEQGMQGERRYLGGRDRWRGLKVVVIGAAYLVVGFGLWRLR